MMSDLVQVYPTDRSQRLRVIGAGHSRTGTMSFTLALQILLQGPVLHSGSACVMREEAFIKGWISALDDATAVEKGLPGSSKDELDKAIHELCDGYLGITDAPATVLVEQLIAAYPEAIVIVTSRDPERWWKSMKAVADTVGLMRALNVLFLPLPTLRYFGTWVDALTRRHSHVFYNGGKYTLTQEHLARHHDYVARVTPKDRLYYFDVKEGWEPLCKILKVPVPDVPFPHANDAQAIQDILAGFIRTAVLCWLAIIAALAVGGWLLWSLL
ncbi:hypothetical protein NQ176_g1396 [Zarea fungicola]|uniref:Uncharacterized protein n=1 Tax=Zarea fungicola TaxID=93591 RepID=A0ACC1NSX4_9HYPO|nr:hypothetical protein NQ176_g1396 [Lecanicillium fungicola]